MDQIMTLAQLNIEIKQQPVARQDQSLREGDDMGF
jgi:hypothetical protein